MKSSQQEECVLCCREIKMYATGACDHPVCYECSTRMRVLCETNECPICRSDMPYVVFTYQVQTFSSVFKNFSLFNKKYQMMFENEDIQIAFERLLENRCNSCDELMPTFEKLKEHNRRKHELHYCELCTDNLKIFTFERKCYSRKDLARHKRLGDPDNTSHRGHPLCEFCDQRYLDKDDLYRHLRRHHFFCHFCDADGKNQYYKDYDFLRVHFRTNHYLCEEDHCVNERFIGAFRTEIDMKAHKAIHHSKNKTRAEAKQARVLDFEFSYNHPRPTGNSSPRGGRYGQNRKRNEENISQERTRAIQQPEVDNFNTQSVQDFPYLSEDALCKTVRSDNSVPEKQLNSLTLTQSYGRNPAPYRKNVMSVEDFPALSSSAATSETSNNQSRKPNTTNNRQNAPPVRTSNASSVLFPQKNVPTSTSEERRLKNSDPESANAPNWKGKKVNLKFEDEFPTLETKKNPSPLEFKRNPAQEIKKSTPVPNSVPDVPPPGRYVDTVITTESSSGDQFVTFKGKSKKKKQNKIYTPPEIDKSEDFTSQFLPYDNDTETFEDQFKKHMVHPLFTSSGSSNHKSNDTWSEEISFVKDDFPPLAPSEPLKKPPGFIAPKAKVPPPGFSTNTEIKQSSIGNKTLSSIVREIVKPNKSDTNGVGESPGYISTEENNDPVFIRPSNFDRRNDELIKRIHDLSNAQSPLFNEFKAISGRFRYDAISADEYHAQCLGILGLRGFLEIFPELVSLLPDIKKQQELLTVHNTFLSQQNGGAVSKKAAKNSNRVVSCDKCKQVLVIDDCKSHARNHNINTVQ